MGVTPMYAICFLGYRVGQDLQRTSPSQVVRSAAPPISDFARVAHVATGMFCSHRGWPRTRMVQLTINQLGIAGALSGVFTTAIMVPGDRIKVILQVRLRVLALSSGSLAVAAP